MFLRFYLALICFAIPKIGVIGAIIISVMVIFITVGMYERSIRKQAAQCSNQSAETNPSAGTNQPPTAETTVPKCVINGPVQSVYMNGKEPHFLLEEYKTAWQMILNIDERRGKFVRYYSFIFLGVFSLSVNLLKNVGSSNPLLFPQAIMITGLLTSAIVVGAVVMRLLYAERNANIRYRKKVNLIREILLKNSKNTDVTDYLTYKELGIKTFTKDEQPKGLGGTLRAMFFWIAVEIAGLLSGIVYVWIIYHITNCTPCY